MNTYLDRLLTLGLVEREGAFWRSSQAHVEVPGVPSSAIRKFHEDVLFKAIQSLEAYSPKERDITTVVVATTHEKLAEAKERIAKFREELILFLQSGKNEEVFSLSIQLFPLKAVVK